MNITEVILVNDCFHRMYSFFLNSVYFIWNAAMSNAAQRIFLWNFSGFRNVLFNGFWQFSCCSFQLAKKTCPYTYRNSYINMFVFSFRSTHIFYLHVLYIYIYYTQKLKSQKQDVSEWILNKKTHFPFSQIFPFHAVQILDVKRPHFKRSILSVTHAYTIYR